jgi:prepilin-type N-terminal cleavage/methylation domain-containing protein
MKKAFTLIEVIVVIGIFSIVSIVSINTFLTTFKVSQKTNIENIILNDARFIMSQITRAVESNTLDYEEYFSHCVMSEDCPNMLYKFPTFKETNWIDARNQPFGLNYGMYNWQFFYGGTTPILKHDGFGTICQVSLDEYVDYPNPNCVTGPLLDSEDIDTGQNPNLYRDASSAPEKGTAFCTDNVYQLFNKVSANGGIDTSASRLSCLGSDFDYDNLGSYMMDELYLIDESGNNKTILALETINSGKDKALSRIEMTKAYQAKTENNINMPLFAFTCSDGYQCTGQTSDTADSLGSFALEQTVLSPLRYDPYVYTEGEDIFSDFVPISPLRVNIKSLKFLVAPLEDPRRSFSESAGNTKIQPIVTVFVELEPSSEFKSPFLSKNFNLKLQTTVTSGIIKEVPIISDSE